MTITTIMFAALVFVYTYMWIIDLDVRDRIYVYQTLICGIIVGLGLIYV